MLDVKVVPIRPGLNVGETPASGADADTTGESEPAREPAADAEPLESPSQQQANRFGTAGKIRLARRAKKTSPVAVLARSLDRSRQQHRLSLEALQRLLVPPFVENPPRPQAADLTAEKDFWEVWLSHLSYLRQHSLRFAGGNQADAEDALSDAMLKAAKTFRNSEIRNHRAWLLRLVHNACMDRHRSARRENRLAKDLTELEIESAPTAAVQLEPSPEELLVAFEQFERLQQALKALPQFLAVPLMRYLDEQSDAEIALSLNVTKEVIRKRRQIARDILRRQISP